MNTQPLASMAEAWREEADLYRRRGQEDLARMAESFAEELEKGIREWGMEPLTVSEAAEESGYSESSLYSLVSEGKLPNLGKPGAPRIPRHALPKKATGPTGPKPVEPTLAEKALERRAS